MNGMKEQVHEAARRARLAATTLATLPRSTKDAALLAAADALVAATDDLLAANALDVEAARAAGTPEHVVDRRCPTACGCSRCGCPSA